jgi:hypothetical protein
LLAFPFWKQFTKVYQHRHRNIPLLRPVNAAFFEIRSVLIAATFRNRWLKIVKGSGEDLPLQASFGGETAPHFCLFCFNLKGTKAI